MALDVAQLATLKAAIAAETDSTFVTLRTAGSTGAMAAWYSDLAVPAFIVWRTLVSLKEVGDAFNGAEFSGLSTAEVSRLSAFADYTPTGINAGLADRRQLFDTVFSTGGITKASLATVWRRSANRVEKLFATGVGTTVAPAVLVFEGSISYTDIQKALAA